MVYELSREDRDHCQLHFGAANLMALFHSDIPEIYKQFPFLDNVMHHFLDRLFTLAPVRRLSRCGRTMPTKIGRWRQIDQSDED